MRQKEYGAELAMESAENMPSGRERNGEYQSLTEPDEWQEWRMPKRTA